jgi:hypothetical protein
MARRNSDYFNADGLLNASLIFEDDDQQPSTVQQKSTAIPSVEDNSLDKLAKRA